MNYFSFLSFLFALLIFLFLVFYKWKKIDLKNCMPKKNSLFVFLSFWVSFIFMIYTWFQVIIFIDKVAIIFGVIVTLIFTKTFALLFFYEKIANCSCKEKMIEKKLLTIKNIDYNLVDLIYLIFIIFFLTLGIFVY